MGAESNYGGLSLDDLNMQGEDYFVEDEGFIEGEEDVVIPVEEEVFEEQDQETQETEDEVTEQPEERKDIVPEDPKVTDQQLKDGKFAKTLSPFAKFLNEQGFIDLKDAEGNDIEIKDYEHLASVMKESIEKNRYSNLNDSQKRYFESLKEGIPQSEFEKAEKSIKAFESLEERLDSDHQLQFDLIYHDYVSKGISKEKASAFANKTMENLEESLQEAREILDRSKEEANNKFEELKKTTKERNKATYESITKIANETQDVIGIPLTKEFKERIISSMTTRAGQNNDGVPLNSFDKWRFENGEKADLILHTLMLYTDGFTKLDKVKGSVKSSAISELDKVLRGSNSSTGGISTGVDDEEDIVYI